MALSSTLQSLVVQPDDGMEFLLASIAWTRRKLLVKQFALREPSFIRAIVQAHQRGVEVRVMLNPQRTDGTRSNDDAYRAFEEVGIPVRWTAPSFSVTHEKSLVMDDTQAWILSFNLDLKYFTKTRDYGILTADPAQVAEITECFEADWERRPFTPSETSGLVWGPDGARQALARFIDVAQESILVQHGKFADPVLIDRLGHAVGRGARVNVVCPGLKPVSEYDLLETSSFLRILDRMKVKVRALGKPQMHAKLLLADQKQALLGSMNLHRTAFEERRELGLVVQEPAVVARLLETFTRDWKAAERFFPPDPFVVLLSRKSQSNGKK